MVSIATIDIPRLEEGIEQSPIFFNINQNDKSSLSLLSGLARQVRVLPFGAALQRQAAFSARIWAEGPTRNLRRHTDPHSIHNNNNNEEEDDDDEEYDDNNNDNDNDGNGGEERGGTQASRRKKFVKLTDEDLLVDWYDILQLTQADGSTEDQIRAAYRRRCLETHPDKQKNHSDEAFKLVQRAFDILGDAETRLAYDSSRPFDDSIPSENLPADADFYAIFAPVFERNKKWSSEPNMPSLGNDNTSIKEVNQFYERWAHFQSWRDFSHLVELDEIDDSMCREERRYYTRENERQLAHLRREEQQRLRTLVERARKNDPRLRRKREEEEARRLKEKEERESRRRMLREEEDRRRAEQAARERNEKEEAQRKLLEAKNGVRNAQKEMLQFLVKNELLDETATNKLLRHAVRRPNVVWLFSKIHNPEEAATILSEVTSGSIERRPAATTPQNTNNSNNNNKHYYHNNRDDDDEGVEVEAVLRFNAHVENKERQIGITRYGEAIKKSVPPPPSVSTETVKKPKEDTTSTSSDSVSQKKVVWDEEDLVRLQKATAKFPPGTIERWSKIAGMLRGKFTEEEAMKKVNEITALLHNANNNNNNNTRVEEQQQEQQQQQQPSVDAATTNNIPAIAPINTVEEWTVKQQKMLEQGLRELKDYKEKDKFQKIAAMVEGKNAKECFERFKYLCAMNKRK